MICPQMADTVDLAIAAWSPSASARVACTSRTGRPRMNEAITRDCNALVLVTWLPNRREAKASWRRGPGDGVPDLGQVPTPVS